MEKETRPALGGKRNVALLYAAAAVACVAFGLILQSQVLFADGVMSLLLFTEILFGRGRTSSAGTVLRLISILLGAYAAIAGFFSLSSLIGYAGDAASIYVFPVFALLIIAKVAILLFSDEDVIAERGLGLGITLLSLAGTVLTFVFYHYFDPSFAAAIGVYALYRGIKGLISPKEEHTPTDLPTQEAEAEEI